MKKAQDMKGKCGTVMAALALFGAIGLMTGVGCRKKNEPSEPKELVLLCGSSFVLPAEQLCKQFTAETGIAIVSTVAGSEDFLPLVKAGKKGDILITHDPYLDETRKAGALSDWVGVGCVAPVLAVPKGKT